MVKSDSNLFNTELSPQTSAQFFEWPYFGFGHGEYISFFTSTALQRLGDSFGLFLAINGAGPQLLTCKLYSAQHLRLHARGGIERLVSAVTQWTSQTPFDHEAMRSELSMETKQA
jgi:hypothetical protein